MKPIVLIPARGGSKRIPRKNIIHINGEPALGILIKNLQSMKLFSKIIVSSNDIEIAEVASNYGAVVSTRSSELLSDDFTSSEEVIRDYIMMNQLQESAIPIFCIYPLAILLSKENVKDSLSILTKYPTKFIIAAGLFQNNPLRHTFKSNDSCIEMLFPENNLKRSQDLDPVYFDAGMLYLAYPSVWLDKNLYWYNNNSKIVVINSEDCIDVDTVEDLNRLKLRYTQFKVPGIV